MTDKELRGLGPALADYLDRYLFCCAYTQTFAHLGTYVRGLLSDLQRKTCEPIALKAGTPVRSLQEFLRDHVWDFERVKQVEPIGNQEKEEAGRGVAASRDGSALRHPRMKLNNPVTVSMTRSLKPSLILRKIAETM